MMFLGSKFCPHCGAAGARDAETETAGKNCPRCKQEFHTVTIGSSTVFECSKCSGLWLNTSTFEKICNDREQQAAVLGAASLAQGGSPVTMTKVNYVPCPVCLQLMNRANFARCSGVIIDLCKKHGIWFDRDELGRIIQFISAGGLDVSRAREKAALEEERRQLHEGQRQSPFNFEERDSDRITGIASAGGLLKLLLG